MFSKWICEKHPVWGCSECVMEVNTFILPFSTAVAPEVLKHPLFRLNIFTCWWQLPWECSLLSISLPLLYLLFGVLLFLFPSFSYTGMAHSIPLPWGARKTPGLPCSLSCDRSLGFSVYDSQILIYHLYFPLFLFCLPNRHILLDATVFLSLSLFLFLCSTCQTGISLHLLLLNATSNCIDYCSLV